MTRTDTVTRNQARHLASISAANSTGHTATMYTEQGNWSSNTLRSLVGRGLITGKYVRGAGIWNHLQVTGAGRSALAAA